MSFSVTAIKNHPFLGQNRLQSFNEPLPASLTLGIALKDAGIRQNIAEDLSNFLF